MPTDQNKSEADAEGQDVSAERLVVLSIALCKDTQSWVDVVLTQSLEQQQDLTGDFPMKCFHCGQTSDSVASGLS